MLPAHITEMTPGIPMQRKGRLGVGSKVVDMGIDSVRVPDGMLASGIGASVVTDHHMAGVARVVPVTPSEGLDHDVHDQEQFLQKKQ